MRHQLGGALRRRGHVAAVSGADRLPRAAPHAYELLGLDDLRELELGAAAAGTSKAALGAYVDGVAAVLGRARESLRSGGAVVVVVNDRRDLYPEILDKAGLRLEQRLRRHVNRRTGRRAGEFFEEVLVAR